MQAFRVPRCVGLGPSTSGSILHPALASHRRDVGSLATSTPVIAAPGPTPAITSWAPCQSGQFAQDNKSFSEEHRVRGAEVAPNQRATMVTIANLLQECAGNHAVGMWGRADAGFANIPSLKDLVFVMTRLQIRMHVYPKWGTIVRVETFFTEDGSLRARRDWNVWDAESGELLGVATSSWVTINMATRRISKIPEDMRSFFMAFAAPLGRIVLPAEETRKKIPDPVLPSEYEGQELLARRSDMDMNGHVNNVVYIAWVLESVPEEVYGSCQLREIEVDFKHECVAGVTVQSVCCPAEAAAAGHATAGTHHHQFLHALYKRDDAKTELVRARSTYLPA